MTEPHLPSPSLDPVRRLLDTARKQDAQPAVPTLHERRLEGMEAAQRLKDRPKPR